MSPLRPVIAPLSRLGLSHRRRVVRSITSLQTVWPWGETDRHEGWRGSNWSGNLRWRHVPIHEPESLEHLQDIVRNSPRIRALGSAHSASPLFNQHDIASNTNDTSSGTTGTSGTIGTTEEAGDFSMVSLRKMPRFCELNEDSGTVTIDAATTYSELSAALSRSGWALPMTAALPQFSVAGALSTGTHGSSGMGADGRLKLGGLAEAAISIEIVGADGDIRVVREGDPGLESSVISLGLSGIVTRVELQLVRDFDVHQVVYGDWPAICSPGDFASVLETHKEVMQRCDAFSWFLDFSVNTPGMLVMKHFIEPGEEPRFYPEKEFYGLRLKAEPVENFLEGGDLETLSVGRWHDKLHGWFKNGAPFGPQGAPELQIEHFVPLTHSQEALERVKLVCENWKGILYAEVRAVRGGDQLMSAYTADEELSGCKDTLAIGIGLDASLGEARVLQAAAVLDECLRDLHAKPHWGKLNNLGPGSVREMYAGLGRFERFAEHVEVVDPTRKFGNEWLDAIFRGGA